MCSVTLVVSRPLGVVVHDVSYQAGVPPFFPGSLFRLFLFVSLGRLFFFSFSAVIGWVQIQCRVMCANYRPVCALSSPEPCIT